MKRSRSEIVWSELIWALYYKRTDKKPGRWKRLAKDIGVPDTTLFNLRDGDCIQPLYDTGAKIIKYQESVK